MVLKPAHPAVTEGRTIFPSRVVDVKDSPRLFISGMNNRKIGRKVVKGEWAGMPIYTLTLEERATCPTYCPTWAACYGNSMHWPRRHRHGPELEMGIRLELRDLAEKHPLGFVVRLHVLGDFYSQNYVGVWIKLLADHDALHIFGYTARAGDDIAEAVVNMNKIFPDRCAIRFSGTEIKPGAAVVVMSDVPQPGAFICPAETSKTECCSTCGLCWAEAARDKAVLFILHGNPGRGGAI